MHPHFGNHEDSENNMMKFLSILQKMLKDYKIEGEDLGQIFDKKNMNLNLCFFTFMPVGQEDFEEIESAFEEFLSRQDDEKDRISPETENAGKSRLRFELNARDVDFLRQNGIKF